VKRVPEEDAAGDRRQRGLERRDFARAHMLLPDA